jgi:N,N'-diacetyllegionaminate synthase
MKRKTLVIAEAGVNHNGSVDLAKQLISVASKAGADYVKFQTFNSNLVVTSTAKQADYQKFNTGVLESQYSMISKLELTKENHYELIDYAKECGIKLFSTAFDMPSVKFLNELGFDLFKIPSGEITNLPLLRQIGDLDKELIISTGMSTLADIENALKVIENSGTSRDKITLLHCTSEYPAPFCDVNLHVMSTLRHAFGTSVGYSDHTEGIEISIAAVALGAKVIEKHFTLDKTMPGPDHKASIEPKELSSLVKSIRNVEISLGDSLKRVTPSEEKNIAVARKSLVASCKISKGDKLSTENIAIKRPGTGISPMRYDEIIGSIAIKDFAPDELIE